MYICVCKAVSDSRIRRAAENGVRTLRELQELTGLGTRCGKCVPQARALLNVATIDARSAPQAVAQAPALLPARCESNA